MKQIETTPLIRVDLLSPFGTIFLSKLLALYPLPFEIIALTTMFTPRLRMPGMLLYHPSNSTSFPTSHLEDAPLSL
jgi:hypothetical protein